MVNQFKLVRFKILILFFGFGSIIPFIPIFSMFLLFFLFYPLLVVLAVSIVLAIFSIPAKKWRLRNSCLNVIISILVFFLAQPLSVFLIDTCQKTLSQSLIGKIENYQLNRGNYPMSKDSITAFYPYFGIEYQFISNNDYKISYWRGFMVNETFIKSEGQWKSIGWND